MRVTGNAKISQSAQICSFYTESTIRWNDAKIIHPVLFAHLAQKLFAGIVHVRNDNEMIVAVDIQHNRFWVATIMPRFDCVRLAI